MAVDAYEATREDAGALREDIAQFKDELGQLREDLVAERSKGFGRKLFGLQRQRSEDTERARD